VAGSWGAKGREAGKAIAQQLEAEGIELHVGVHANKVEASEGGVTVHLENGATVSAQHILVATGRRPRIGELALENIGIDTPPAATFEVRREPAHARPTTSGRSAT